MPGFPGMGGVDGDPMSLQNGFRAASKKKPKKREKGNPWGKVTFESICYGFCIAKSVDFFSCLI